MLELFNVKGHVAMKLVDKDGNVKMNQEKDNMIVTAGLIGIAQNLLSTGTAIGKPSHVAIGTGTTAPALAQTALVAESGARQSAVVTRTNNVITFTCSFTAGTIAIAEAGIFNAASAGTLYSRVTFPVVNKAADDTFSITWTWTIQ